MFTRRQTILTAIPAALATQADAAQGDFGSFVAGVYAEATAAGIRRDILDAAFAGVQPNQRVIDKDRRQAEFNMTWTRYKALVISEKRIANGRIAISQNRALFSQVEARYGVGANVIAGIWGLESSFGAETGDYKVIESLAEGGTAVILISSDFEELIFCHRVIVMREGRVTQTVVGEGVTKANLTHLCYEEAV